MWMDIYDNAREICPDDDVFLKSNPHVPQRLEK
jgi:hypothetical protein